MQKLCQQRLFLLSLVGIFIISMCAESINAQRRVSRTTRINRLIKKGGDQIETGNFKEAMTTFNQCIALKPTFIQGHSCYFGRGISRHLTGQFKEALADFAVAERNKPGDMDLRYFRGIAYSEVGEYEKAELDLNFVRVITPSENLIKRYPDIYFQLGVVYSFLEKFPEALDHLNKAIEISPKAVLPYVSRGLTFEKMGKFAEAREDFQKAIELDPRVKDSVEPMLERINATENSDTNVEKLVDSFDQAAQKEIIVGRPQAALDLLNGIENKTIADHPIFYQTRAISHIYLKEFEQGDEYFAKLLTHVDAKALDARSKADKIFGDPAKLEDYKLFLEAAVDFYETAYIANDTRRLAYRNIADTEPVSPEIKGFDELRKKYAESLTKFGEYYFNTDQTELALVQLDKAIEVSPNRVETYFQRGRFFTYTKNYDKAIADFSKVIEIEPTNATAFTDRAAVYRRMNKYDSAIADATKAIEVNSDKRPEKTASLYNYRGLIYNISGKYELAIIDFTKAISTNSSPVGSHFLNRAEAYCGLSEETKATADEQKALELGEKIIKTCKQLQ